MGPNTASAMMRAFGIKSKENFAIWFGQIQHESGNFAHGRENLAYSSAGLLNIFRKYYLPYAGLAEKHAYKPELIANHVYCNRMGNGNEASGDGFKYRGGGCLQLTGKANYQAYFKWAGLPIDSDPDIITEPMHYFKSAVWFFDVNGVWKNCSSVSKANITACSKHVNLGNPKAKSNPNGLYERIALTEKIARTIGVA